MDVEAAKVIPGVRVDEGAGFSPLDGADHAIAAAQALLAGTRMEHAQITFKPRTMGQAYPDMPEYQQWGMDFIRVKVEQGVLVRDDVGLGKTVETLRALAPLDMTKVVLCPAFLRPQWAGEVAKWTGQQSFVFKPASLRRKKDVVFNPVLHRWIIGYYTDAQHIIDLLGYVPYTLVIDEIHNLRGLKTDRAQLMQGVCNFAAGRVGLTASLLTNDGPKMFPVLNLVQPGAFGSYYDFSSRYSNGRKGEWGWEESKDLFNPDELRARLSYFSFRRVREDVADQLPFSTRFQTLRVEVSPDLQGPALLSMSKRPTEQASYMARLAEAKNPAVVEAVLGDVNANVPSITFTYLRGQAEALAARVPGALCLHGDTVAHLRLAQMHDWLQRCKAGRITPAMFTTLDAMGEGANLQWAKAVNFAALDYTPDRLRQAIGRVARMGQSGIVNVRIFVAQRTADEHFVDILLRKLKENFRLDGRKEQSKGELEDALSPKATAAAMTALYEKFLKQEV